MPIEVTKAEYLDGYRVKLLFNNGETRIADLSQSLNGAVFAPLKDIEFFKRFTIKFNTIEWENGADFAPEYLYEIGGGLCKRISIQSPWLHFGIPRPWR